VDRPTTLAYLLSFVSRHVRRRPRDMKGACDAVRAALDTGHGA
jgi:hypothetical protein